ncbi:hypothetical protein GCM10010276_37130 [Streptomyces longisporus]|uniref:Uncharacterized protein n=1 Tax=Streptomyces longisporus TaxID=1948 RepID=A0ABP5ZED9_STRLO
MFRADRRHLIAAVGVFTVKHSPIWLLPLITASVIDALRSPPVRQRAPHGHHSALALCTRAGWARSPWLVLAGAALVSYYGVWGVTHTKGLESVRSVGEVLQAPELEATRARRNSPRCAAPSPSRVSATRTTTAGGPPYATSRSP